MYRVLPVQFSHVIWALASRISTAWVLPARANRRRVSDRLWRFSSQVSILEERLLLSGAPVGDLAEGNASAWTAFATDNAVTSISNDTTHVRSGAQSLHFATGSGFDTGIRLAADAGGWNLTTVNLLDMWVFGDNQTGFGWQGNQPKIVLNSAAGSLTLEPNQQAMSNGTWTKLHVPLAGDSVWQVTNQGTFDMTHVTSLEIHQDTWDFGFDVYYDGVQFANRSPDTLPPAGPAAPAGVNPDAISPKVLVYVFDPVMENLGGVRQHAAYGWDDPVSLASQVAVQFENNSHGLVNYQLQTQVVDAHPYFEDGFQHTDLTFAVAWNARDFHDTSHFDYARFAIENNIAERIDSGDIDEVWIYAGPISGMWESAMGGAGAYWINGPTQPIPSERAFPIMGLNFERGVAEAIHSFGHRVEGTLDHIYDTQGTQIDNSWDKFTFQNRYESGLGGLGNVHFPVNGTSDYDYGNSTFVTSNADDWYNYPNFQGLTRSINAQEWYDPEYGEQFGEFEGEQYGYLNWWYDHLPHFAGRGTDFRLNNWWRYVVDLNQFKSGSSSLALTEGTPVVDAATPATATGLVNYTASAFVDGALGRVDFYVDGVYQQTDALAPFTFQWDTSLVADGDHVIDFRAYDLQNQTEGKSAPKTVNVSNGEGPAGISLSSTSITENNAANAVIGTLTATAPVSSGSFTFSLVPGTGSTDNTSFAISGNTLSIIPVTDFESKSLYSIRVQAVDQNGLAIQQQFTIVVIDENVAPTISAIAAQTIQEDTPTAELSFVVGDSETTAANLTVSATSSNLALIPNANLLLSGANGNRTLVATPAANQSGTAVITITVSDGTVSTAQSFVITVQPVDDTPSITLNPQPLSTPGKKPVVIDGGATISLIDSPTLAFAGSTLRVSGQLGKETLSILKQNGLSRKGKNLLFQKAIIGTVGGGTKGVALTVQLNGTATQNSVQMLLRSITFKAAGRETVNRTIQFQITNIGGTDTSPVSRQIQVRP